MDTPITWSPENYSKLDSQLTLTLMRICAVYFCNVRFYSSDVVVVQSLSHVWLFVTPWIVACQAPLSSTISQSLFKFMSIESVMPSNHLILCCPLLLLPSVFPSLRIFSSEFALCIRWPKYWSFSFSIGPSNEFSGLLSYKIEWFNLLAIQGILESSPAPQFKRNNSLVLNLLYGPTLKSVHDYWKNHRFDCTDLCWQSNVSAF